MVFLKMAPRKGYILANEKSIKSFKRNSNKKRLKKTPLD